MSIRNEWRDYDVIVVGSGGAGSHAALAAAEAGARVLLVSKDPIGCSDTKISEGIATVREAGSDEDTEAELSENLKMAGGDLPLEEITKAFAKERNWLIWSRSNFSLSVLLLHRHTKGYWRESQ